LKLISEFRKQIDRLGIDNIRQAWFTSFNLSPHFVETYILQALAGQNERMSSLADYEALQQKLLDQDTDIRFFSDASAIDPSEPKRTSIPFHLVNPRLLGPSLANGVFHPKVMLLRAEDGTTVVGTGSANLTVSGWGRNREVFLFRRINDTINRERVLSFFRRLFGVVSADFPDLQISVSDEEGASPDWRFLSSLNGDRLFDFLKEGRGDVLSVWSPYFSEDIVAFKRSFVDPQFGPNVRMVVYPDVVEDAGYVRVRISDKPDVKAKLAAAQDIAFRKVHWQDAGSDVAMTHAKVWQFGQKTAVGSWNCTQAGTNVHLNDDSGRHSCNIEAGIVLTDAVLDDVAYKELSVQDCLMPDDQLKQEQEALPKGSERLPFFLEVTFDWQSRAFGLKMRGVPGGERWRLSLPGKKSPILLPHGEGEHTVAGVSIGDVMRKRTYAVQQEGDQRVFSGIVVEKGIRERPAYRFETFSDLLDAWNSGQPERKSEMHPPAVAAQTEGFEEIGSYAALPAKSARPDYFRMFRAFQNMQEKFNNGAGGDEVRRLIQTYPGSLVETSEKIRDIVGKGEFSEIFRWFLKMEYQAVLNVARAKADHHGLTIEWDALSLADVEVAVPGAGRDLLALAAKLAEYDGGLS
jgi:hypothetical protein